MPDWFTFPNTKDIVLGLLAFYGAALSTFNWRQAVRKEKREVHVKASTAFPVFGGSLGDSHTKIEATNVGQRPVTVTALFLAMPDGRRIVPFTNGMPGISNTQLPASLKDGETAHAFFEDQDLAGGLIRSGLSGKVRLVPTCEDSVGGKHSGASFEVDLSK